MSLASARADLAETLADSGYKVYAYESPKVLTGAVILDEAEPLLEYGDVLAQPDLMQVNFDLWLFQDSHNSREATKRMDAMVEAVVKNLGEWTLTNLRSHFRGTLKENGPVWLMSTLSVTNFTRIGVE